MVSFLKYIVADFTATSKAIKYPFSFKNEYNVETEKNEILCLAKYSFYRPSLDFILNAAVYSNAMILFEHCCINSLNLSHFT